MRHHRTSWTISTAIAIAALSVTACGGEGAPPAEANNAANNGGDATNNDDANNDDADNNDDTPALGAGVAVEALEARSCEVVVVDAGHTITDASFDASLEGRAMRRGDKLALVFVARGDEAMPAEAVTFELASASGDDGGAPAQLIKGRCFDGEGELIAEPGVRLAVE